MNTFDRKKFLKAAEAYLAKLRQNWLDGIIGKSHEAAALKMARQDWIMPNEDLTAITITNLFPDVELPRIAEAIEAGGTPEPDAKKYIANLAARNLHDASDKLLKIEGLEGEPVDKPDKMNLAALEKEVNEPAFEGHVRGYVADVTHSPRICHTVEIEQHFLYTFDKALAEMAKAAKRQKMHLCAEWKLGEFGCRLERIVPVDPDKPKLVEEIIP